MDRRELLAGAWILGVGCAAGMRPALAAGPPPKRRVRPVDPDWPSEHEWSRLKRSLTGRLIRPAPLLQACHADSAAPGCAAVVANLRNPYFIGDQPAGTQVSGWLDAWQPAPSAYAVECRTPADAVAAVNFAREHRLRLVVKGGGHSYQGTSNAPDSLLVWTRAMHGITLHEAFVARGGEGLDTPCPAVTVESGAVWMDVYDAVTTRAGRYVQGGGCATVGVAGLVQSGGFGSFSKRFGSAAGSLLEAELVTADGLLRTVNARTDPDLFWALRGGGGGSWGVITKLTLKTHALPDFFGAAWGTIAAASDAGFRRLIARFVDFYATALFNPHWGESVAIGSDNTLKISLVSQGLDTETAVALWQPFFDWVRASPAEYRFTDEPGAGSRPAVDWWDAQARRRRGSTSVIFDERPGAAPTHAWWSGDQEQVGAFLHAYDSAWLPAALLEAAARASLVEALYAGSRHLEIGLHFNKGLAGAPAAAIGAARATATNAVVAESFALAIVATGGAPRYPGLPRRADDDREAHDNALKVRRAMDGLLTVAPTPGSYVSESDYFNARWQEAFWGTNYSRLRAVKDRIDPTGLFFVHHGVGSEDWSADGFMRLA